MRTIITYGVFLTSYHCCQTRGRSEGTEVPLSRSPSTFPLRCARLRAHIGHETSAHKKTWSAHKCSFQNVSAHISCTSFKIQKSSGTMLHIRYFMRTDFEKLEPWNIGHPSYEQHFLVITVVWQLK